MTNKESGKQLKIQTNKQQYIDNDTNKYTDKTRTNCPKDQSTWKRKETNRWENTDLKTGRQEKEINYAKKTQNILLIYGDDI